MKNLFVKLFSTFAIVIILGCNNQYSESELALKDCINEKVNYNIQKYTGKSEFDFFEFSLKVEKILLENKLIANNEKQEYLEFLKGIDTLSSSNGLIAYNQIQELTDNYGFSYNLFIIIDGVLNQCPYNIYKSQKLAESHLIYREGKILKKLMDNGYYQEEFIEELFEEIDQKQFDKILYKAPVIYLILMNMDFRYDSRIKRGPVKILGN